MRSPILCFHANENPNICECPSDCYCQTHTCKDRVKEAVKEGIKRYGDAIVGMGQKESDKVDDDLQERAEKIASHGAYKFAFHDLIKNDIAKAMQDVRDRSKGSIGWEEQADQYLEEIYCITNHRDDLLKKLEKEQRLSNDLWKIVNCPESKYCKGHEMVKEMIKARLKEKGRT